MLPGAASGASARLDGSAAELGVSSAPKPAPGGGRHDESLLSQAAHLGCGRGVWPDPAVSLPEGQMISCVFAHIATQQFSKALWQSQMSDVKVDMSVYDPGGQSKIWWQKQELW